MNNRERIGRRIAELRIEKGWSQEGLAQSCGMQQQNIARIELGKYSTGIDILSRIAEALGVQLDFVEN